MHHLVKLFFLLAALCINTILFAAADVSAEQLAQQLKAINTIEANFRQTLKNGNGKVIQTSSGTLFIKKPNRFRWQITKPSPQLILADGKNIWIYDKDLMQVTVKSLHDGLAQTPAALLSGNSEALVKAYQVSKDSRDFVLVPKDEQSNYQWIKLAFDSKNLLQDMQIKDKLGQISEVKFMNVMLNKPLSKDKFYFKPPKGVDVIGKSE